jgi:Subtilase family/FlgD Ig-like domain
MVMTRTSRNAIARFVIACLLITGLLLTVGAAGAVELNSRLNYLASQAEKSAPSFAGSLRFTDEPDADDLARLEALGVEFFDFGQGPVGSRTVLPARIPFASLEALAVYDGLAAVDCAWHPYSVPPLPVSRPQVEAELAWQVDGPGGGTLSGEGVLVCDLDTGVNFFHANFFDLSGEVFPWLDVDLNGSLSIGDAVDLDRNGLRGSTERLRFSEADYSSVYGNDVTRYDTDFDYLYNDANANGSRDYGPAQFSESDPCYGERLFLVDDTDGDGRLDVGENLLALGTSRVRAILNKDGSVHRRGVDLINSETDAWGHGTQVTGIMGGGWRGLHEMTGIAPGIETIHVNMDYYDEPPFLVPVEAGLAWAVAEGADVVLVEDGEWVWEYLDGSSNLEIMINEYAAQGVIVVVAAGNLSSGHMHARFPSAGGQQLTVDPAYTIVWPSFLWTDPVSLGLEITPPAGTPITLPLDGSTLVAQGYRIYSDVSVSARGTHRIDLRLASTTGGSNVGGAWSFDFVGPDTDLHGFYGDDAYGWSSNSRWLTGEDPAYTVTWPATADSSISVAAYAPGGDGAIDYYSGWGPRIDGRPDVDIAAPGAYVLSVSPRSDMNTSWFNGTSGAAPHVAGAAALLKELVPDLDNGQCRQILSDGAGQDQHTTDPDRAGAGKLRIFAAISRLLSAVSDTPRHSAVALRAAPNPFNPSTVIRFQMPAGGDAQLRIFNLAGREVWSRTVHAEAAGEREVAWNGRDLNGKTMPSGVYFAHVKQGDIYAASKLTLVK